MIISIGNAILTVGGSIYTLGSTILRYLMIRSSMQTNIKASVISFLRETQSTRGMENS